MAEPTFLVCFIAFSSGLEPELSSRLHTELLLRLPHQPPITDVISGARVYQFPFSLNACVFAFCGPQWGSNPRPPACKAGALPTELRAHIPIFYPILLNERSQYYMVYRKPYKQFYTLWKTDKLSITNSLLPATSHFKTT